MYVTYTADCALLQISLVRARVPKRPRATTERASQHMGHPWTPWCLVGRRSAAGTTAATATRDAAPGFSAAACSAFIPPFGVGCG